MCRETLVLCSNSDCHMLLDRTIEACFLAAVRNNMCSGDRFKENVRYVKGGERPLPMPHNDGNGTTSDQNKVKDHYIQKNIRIANEAPDHAKFSLQAKNKANAMKTDAEKRKDSRDRPGILKKVASKKEIKPPELCNICGSNLGPPPSPAAAHMKVVVPHGRLLSRPQSTPRTSKNGRGGKQVKFVIPKSSADKSEPSPQRAAPAQPPPQKARARSPQRKARYEAVAANDEFKVAVEKCINKLVPGFPKNMASLLARAAAGTR